MILLVILLITLDEAQTKQVLPSCLAAFIVSYVVISYIKFYRRDKINRTTLVAKRSRVLEVLAEIMNFDIKVFNLPVLKPKAAEEN